MNIFADLSSLIAALLSLIVVIETGKVMKKHQTLEMSARNYKITILGILFDILSVALILSIFGGE